MKKKIRRLRLWRLRLWRLSDRVHPVRMDLVPRLKMQTKLEQRRAAKGLRRAFLR